MSRKRPQNTEKKPIYFDRRILKSKAFWKLNVTATKYLIVLFGRRQMHPLKTKGEWIIKNNGNILFPYLEAKKRFGIHSNTHLRALRELQEHGFIDVNHFGGGMDGDATTFFISNRWKQYGSPDFVEKEWPKDTRKKGNPKIKNYGKGRKPKHNYYP